MECKHICVPSLRSNVGFTIGAVFVKKVGIVALEVFGENDGRDVCHGCPIFPTTGPFTLGISLAKVSRWAGDSITLGNSLEKNNLIVQFDQSPKKYLPLLSNLAHKSEKITGSFINSFPKAKCKKCYV